MDSLLLPKAAVAVIAGYLAGSINCAIVVTRLATGKDIRELGNRNPGTANVAREVGLLWAVPVFFGDLAKSVLPMLLVQNLFGAGWAAELRTLVVTATGVAAFVGHRRPLFFGFRGGAGMATAIGIYLLLAPAEIVAAILIGFASVMLLVRNRPYRVGRWTPIVFTTLAPFLTLGTSLAPSVSLLGRVSLGGHPWHVVLAVFAVSLLVGLANLNVLRETLGREASQDKGGGEARGRS